MPFDPAEFEANVALRFIPTEQLPAVAQDAMEAGFDGPHLVRMAILLHGFTKATAAVEESDKKIGRTRMAIHESRLAARTGQKTAPRTPAKENKRR